MLMLMYNISHIIKAQLEITSRCNASCPACSRNISGGPISPTVVPEDLTLNDIQQMFPMEIIKNLIYLNYCGNLGDPGLAKNLIEIITFFKQNGNDSLIQHIKTNGGMHKPDRWIKLGKLFQKKYVPGHPLSHSGVTFSVDGLADTNHIYRRGVIWNNVYRNMQAYSDSGGYGVWEWLIFDHNKHQIDDAQDLANKLGFSFIIKQPVGFGELNGKRTPMQVLNKNGKYAYSIWPADHIGDKIELNYKMEYDPIWGQPVEKLSEFSSQLGKKSCIKCKSLHQPQFGEEIFVSASGHLLPCCYLGGAFEQRNSSYSRRQFNEMVNKIGYDTFNLRKHNMIDILQGPAFNKFFMEGWNKPSIEEGKILFCVEVCGEESTIDKIYDHTKLTSLSKFIPIRHIA